MTQRLLSRQFRYDRLERYAQGDHDLPNGDKRYVVALRELQRKCRTNYCELVIKAVTERMRVIGFQFGPDQQVDEEAKAFWYYNDMEVQSQVAIMMAATFGDAYMMVTPPAEDDAAEAEITINSSKSTTPGMNKTSKQVWIEFWPMSQSFCGTPSNRQMQWQFCQLGLRTPKDCWLEYSRKLHLTFSAHPVS